MDNIQTMAVKVTEETWPIATACLAGGFANIPFKKVNGAYLIINGVWPQSFKETGRAPVITIGNSWLKAENFHERYEFIEKELKNKFAAVRTIN